MVAPQIGHAGFIPLRNPHGRLSKCGRPHELSPPPFDGEGVRAHRGANATHRPRTGTSPPVSPVAPRLTAPLREHHGAARYGSCSRRLSAATSTSRLRREPVNQPTRGRYVTRETILDLLSDDETAKVSNAESGTLAEGDEYLDLAAIEKGVQRTDGVAIPIGQVIPKKAVLDRTWRAIMQRISDAHLS